MEWSERTGNSYKDQGSTFVEKLKNGSLPKVTEKDEVIKSLIDSLPAHEQQELQKIINDLRNFTGTNLETIILLLLHKILNEFSEEKIQEIVNNLTEQEKADLMQEIDKLVTEMNLSLQVTSPEDAIKTLISLVKTRARKKLGRFSSQEGYLNEIDKKALKDLEEEMKRDMFYQLYKFMTPNPIAGETRLENFINNIVRRGADFAIHKDPQFAEKLPAGFIEALDKVHHGGHVTAELRRGGHSMER